MKEVLPVNEDVIYNQQLSKIERSHANSANPRVQLWPIYCWMAIGLFPILLWGYSLASRALAE